MSMPKVSFDQVKEAIRTVTYTVLPSGRATVCEITLYNGFVVHGISAVTFIENNVKERGENTAYNNALPKVFEHLSFQLREAHFASNMHDPNFDPLR